VNQQEGFMHATFERRPSPSRQPLFGLAARGPAVRAEWAAWLPLLFIGAMMFWTVALGLGGWSLMVVGDGAVAQPVVPSATAIEPKPVEEAPAAAAGDTIPVQMEESTEPEDVNDNPGSGEVPSDHWIIY
jgi:hypothetical protein